MHYEIFTGPEDRGVHDDAEFFDMSHNIFREIDEMMKHMFSGFGRLGIEESFPDAEGNEGFSNFFLNNFLLLLSTWHTHVGQHLL